MAYFTKIVRRLIEVGTALGAAFLVGMMVLIVANIVYRMTGHVIPGSFELSELMIVVTAAFALGYAALQKSHVDVNIVVSHFPPRLQSVIAAIVAFLSMGTWAVVAWASAVILSDRWLTEETDMLLIPYLPFRIVLFVGLILISLVYLIDMIRALREAVMK